MECDMTPSTPSTEPSPVLPDTVHFGMLTSPVQTLSVSCYIDSFGDLEIAALLKEKEAIQTFEQTLEDTRKEVGSHKAFFCRLQRAFDKQKKNCEKTLQSFDEKLQQKRIDDRNLADMKDTISNLRKQVDLLELHQHALPMLHRLLFHLTGPDIVYTDKVNRRNFLHKVLASNRHIGRSYQGELSQTYAPLPS